MNNNTENLRNIYDDISRWLVYAEAKHAAVITVVLFFGGQLLDTDGVLGSIPSGLKVVFCILNCIVLLLSICSFIPFLNQTKCMTRLAGYVYRKPVNKNVLFYLSVFQMEMDAAGSYEQALKNCFSVSQFDSLEKAYILQIQDVSRVAAIKNALFKIEVLLIAAIGLCWCVMCILVA